MECFSNKSRDYASPPPSKHRRCDFDAAIDASVNEVSRAHKFQVKTYSSFYAASKFPFFRQPKEIGAFSVDKNRRYHNDRSAECVYIRPANFNDVSFNLRTGYADFIRKDESEKEFLNNLLTWILSNESKFQIDDGKNESLNTDFICWRGLLTKLLCTPYENMEGWIIAIVKWRETFYLCEFETEQRKIQKENMTKRQDEMSYWGWKFEQYVTADDEFSAPDTTKPVNNNEEFGSVVRTRLNKHSLVFGGEVDAFDKSSENTYVEMKTTREIETQRQDHNFKRFKLLKWWAQSFLLGIPKIVCGYRDDDGTVHRLEEFSTLHLPRLTKDLRDPWNPNVCFTFLDQLLEFVKTNIREDSRSSVHLLTWNPKEDVILRKLEGEDAVEYKFLPDHYFNSLDQILSPSADL